MLHVPKLGHYFTPARFAGIAGVYVMKITLENGTFTKIGTTQGGQENRTAEWGEHQQVFCFLEFGNNVTRAYIESQESQVRKLLGHNDFQPLKLEDGTQSRDWFAEEALGCAIWAIKKLGNTPIGQTT